MANFLISLWTDNPLARSFFTSIVLLMIYVIYVGRLRRKAGQTHPSYRPEDVRFKESHVSGFSDRTLSAKKGGARNALTVTVLHDAVLIEPESKLKRLIPPSLNELECYVKKSDIIQSESDSLFGHKTVRIKFNAHDRSVRTVTLILKNPEAFVRAVNLPASDRELAKL